MNFLKENTGAVVTLLALVNLSISMVYNYFYFAAFGLSLDMIPASYSDYLISSLDVLSIILCYAVVIAVCHPLLEYFLKPFTIRKIKSMNPDIDRGNPLHILFIAMKIKLYKVALIIHAVLFLVISVIMFTDFIVQFTELDLYLLSLARVCSLFVALCLVAMPILTAYYDSNITSAMLAMMLALSFSAFSGSIAGHQIKFATNVPHVVNVADCKGCIIVKSLSDTYILWNYSENSIVMVNRSEQPVFTVDLKKDVRVK